MRCYAHVTHLRLCFKIGRRRDASSVLLLQITDLKGYGTSIPCRRRKNAKVLVFLQGEKTFKAEKAFEFR